MLVARLSQYSFSQLPFIIPFSYIPPKSFNYIHPPSVIVFIGEKYNHKSTIPETKIFLMKQWVVFEWVFIVFTECIPLLIFG